MPASFELVEDTGLGPELGVHCPGGRSGLAIGARGAGETIEVEVVPAVQAVKDREESRLAVVPGGPTCKLAERGEARAAAASAVFSAG